MIDLSRYDHGFLNRSLATRMAEVQAPSLESYMDDLARNRDEEQILRERLSISYSEFFRNPLTTAVLERIVLPAVVRRSGPRRELRIWSAACAAGQEAFSLAILLEELRAGGAEFTYRIFATDWSTEELVRAQEGVYSRSEVRNLSMKRADEWFSEEASAFTVKPVLRRAVEFSYFDLFDGSLVSPPTSIFGGFDLIFCANILFYYLPAIQESILKKLEAALVPGGYLITDAAERDMVVRRGHQEIFPQSAIFQYNPKDPPPR